jgi:hypothetical protein
VNVHINSIDEIAHIDNKATNFITLTIGAADLYFDEKPVEIKVGNDKVTVSILEFMQAFKDMLDTGTFEMDQINSLVWDIETELEVAKEQRDNCYEALEEIRGNA